MAKAFLDRFEFVCIAKNGSWSKMAAIELASHTEQCIKRKTADIEIIRNEVRVGRVSGRTKKSGRIGFLQPRMLG
jgi:hypothetical protein